LDHLLLARVALSCLCGIQAIATVAIDFNRTHATNPLWTGHARFHLVWQSATIVFLSALELLLIWFSGLNDTPAFYLALVLAALSPLGFLTAYVSRRRYAGTLSDPNGIPSARVRLFGDVRAIDMNLAIYRA
jgi:hypothetical protein